NAGCSNKQRWQIQRHSHPLAEARHRRGPFSRKPLPEFTCARDRGPPVQNRFVSEAAFSIKKQTKRGRKAPLYLGKLSEKLTLDQRLENWKDRRAFPLPYFLRSTTRESRVRKPPFFSGPRRSGSK